jgi:hypothetical protein
MVVINRMGVPPWLSTSDTKPEAAMYTYTFTYAIAAVSTDRVDFFQ